MKEVSKQLDRRAFLGLTGTTLAGSVAAGWGADANANALETEQASSRPAMQSAGRPNIILFMPDEMRADSLSCYGNPACKTPNFDHLARTGTRFANCHVQYPVCGASRCSLLTGWPTSVRGHRSLFYFLRPEEPNLFRYLKDSGYDVFWLGKNDALAAQSFCNSVTEWAGGGALTPSGAGPNPVITPGIASMLHGPGGTREDTFDYKLIESAIKIIERKESERPFCIYLSMIEPHPPYTIPADFYKMYSPSEIPPLIPPIRKKKPDFHEGIRQICGLDKAGDAVLRQVRAVYYGQVSYSDWLMGQLIESLEKNGRTNDTAVFLLSDHGDYTGDYGLVEKWPSGLEDCLTHVPLIARVPGGRPAGQGEDMVELYDVMQTCLDLAGVRAQHTHFARSLLPQLSGQAADARRAAFAEGGYNVYEPQCFEPLANASGEYLPKVRLQNEQPQMVSRCSMIRTRTHKLIVRPQGQSELYDSVHDPHETENLYGDRSHSAIQIQLQDSLLEHFINTSGIAPMDKDSRLSPPFYPTRTDLPPANWHRTTLDAGEEA